LHPRGPASRVHACSWFLQSVVEGEIHPQLTFFSDEAWCHSQEYINTQNNRYWYSQNPHLTHEVPLHPMKFGVWCPVSARNIVPVFFNETINCEIYLHVAGQHFQHLWSLNCNYFTPKFMGRQACWFIGKIRLRLAAGGAMVAVKHRAVELVNKIKILLLCVDLITQSGPLEINIIFLLFYIDNEFQLRMRIFVWR
jgi:hypothetical protein